MLNALIYKLFEFIKYQHSMISIIWYIWQFGLKIISIVINSICTYTWPIHPNSKFLMMKLIIRWFIFLDTGQIYHVVVENGQPVWYEKLPDSFPDDENNQPEFIVDPERQTTKVTTVRTTTTRTTTQRPRTNPPEPV